MTTMIKTGSIALMMLLICSCSDTYYSAMESVGIHKRDILTDRIENARDAQQEAKEQFHSALDRFSKELNFYGGDLEDTYNALNDEFELSKKRAETVHDRIDAVENVAEALFEEWQEELNNYTNKKLRAQSATQLKTTQQRYQQMLKSMHTAEKRIEPVLNTFQDQVLYLKHNLNARAINSLKGEFGELQKDINVLLRDMDKSIDQANQFIDSLASNN